MHSSGWTEHPYDHTGSDPLPVIGIDHADKLTNLEFKAGSLRTLTGNSIAITAQDAQNLDLGVGGTLTYRFGDAAQRRLTVAAVLDSDRGSGLRMVSGQLLAEHVRDSPSTVIVRAPSGKGEHLATSLHKRPDNVGIKARVESNPAVA